MQSISQHRNSISTQIAALPPRQALDLSMPYSLSIVIPLYNEAESLPHLLVAISKEAPQIASDNWEVILVDDGSDDNSFAVIVELMKTSPNVKCIRFRRNYGKSAALSAGFAQAKGKYVITMDADLQDDPKEFPQMLKKIEEGYDLVSGWKKKRYDPISKTLPSKFFNFVTSISAGIKLHDFNCGFKMYRNEVIQTLDVYGEMHRYLPALAHWNGFKITEIPVEHHKRQFGKSKFGLSRFTRGFLDLLTVVFTTRYLKRPLHFFGVWGITFILIGMSIFGILSLEWLMNNISLSNRPLAWASLGLAVIGVQLFSVGLIGELVVKQAHVTKNANFHVSERIV